MASNKRLHSPHTQLTGLLVADKIEEASNLIKDIEPKLPNEFILKAIVNANIGQSQNSHEHLKMAQNYYQLIGGR